MCLSVEWSVPHSVVPRAKCPDPGVTGITRRGCSSSLSSSTLRLSSSKSTVMRSSFFANTFHRIRTKKQGTDCSKDESQPLECRDPEREFKVSADGKRPFQCVKIT